MQAIFKNDFKTYKIAASKKEINENISGNYQTAWGFLFTSLPQF